jgi:hypothetical protein
MFWIQVLWYVFGLASGGAAVDTYHTYSPATQEPVYADTAPADRPAPGGDSVPAQEL